MRSPILSILIATINRRKVFVAQFILIFILCGCLGCDFIYRLINKEGAEEKKLVGEIVLHERNIVVEEIQTLLKLYGYNAGKVDGVLGFRTREAVAQFQKDNSLKESRFVDQQTWERLNIFKKNKLVVNDDLNVKLIQKILKKAGFNPGKADGKFGENTKKAVKQFQNSHGLNPDGKIGYKTLLKFSEYLLVD
jgi:N-acetyl-anhydromuramyl-L-alanine amidase AmpD